jgi:ketosteroid isomerase-like protein
MLKKIALVLGLLAVGAALAQSPEEAGVAGAAEKLRVAMIDPDTRVLDAVVAPELSYGHSSGRVENKAEFMASLMNGSSDFVTLDLTEQSIRLVKDTAIVRHVLNATTNDSGKPGTVSLKVLQVWQNQQGQWKLLARQAVR